MNISNVPGRVYLNWDNIDILSHFCSHNLIEQNKSYFNLIMGFIFIRFKSHESLIYVKKDNIISVM